MRSMLEMQVHKLCSDRLQRIGFEAVEFLSFCRCIERCNQIINVGGRVEGRAFRFTCTLGLRFDCIEALLRPKIMDKSYPTVSCPVHLLRPEREYYEWEGTDLESLTISVDSMMVELEEVGFDFFNRFKTKEAIEDELSNSPVSDSLILSLHQRIGILAAIALLRGERSRAENILFDAISDPKNQNPRKILKLQEVRSQLLGK